MKVKRFLPERYRQQSTPLKKLRLKRGLIVTLAFSGADPWPSDDHVFDRQYHGGRNSLFPVLMPGKEMEEMKRNRLCWYPVVGCPIVFVWRTEQQPLRTFVRGLYFKTFPWCVLAA